MNLSNVLKYKNHFTKLCNCFEELQSKNIHYVTTFVFPNVKWHANNTETKNDKIANKSAKVIKRMLLSTVSIIGVIFLHQHRFHLCHTCNEVFFFHFLFVTRIDTYKKIKNKRPIVENFINFEMWVEYQMLRQIKASTKYVYVPCEQIKKKYLQTEKSHNNLKPRNCLCCWQAFVTSLDLYRYYCCWSVCFNNEKKNTRAKEQTLKLVWHKLRIASFINYIWKVLVCVSFFSFACECLFVLFFPILSEFLKMLFESHSDIVSN